MYVDDLVTVQADRIIACSLIGHSLINLNSDDLPGGASFMLQCDAALIGRASRRGGVSMNAPPM